MYKDRATILTEDTIRQNLIDYLFEYSLGDKALVGTKLLRRYNNV